MQLDAFKNGTRIEVVIIEPTKEMPLEVYRELYRFSYFSELMEKESDNVIIWDETVSSIFNESMADVEYEALQNDWFKIPLCIPKKFIDHEQH